MEKLSLHRKNICMKIIAICLFLFNPLFISAQESIPYFRIYEKYADSSISKKRFSHDQLIKAVQKHQNFGLKELGKSVENREIQMLTIGNGPRKILLWSQMHGNESTATLALLDILNFFKASDEWNIQRQALLKEVTIYMIPMLNPDGADQFKRHNAVGIDLNRDALRLSMPESRILKNARDQINPDWGFNLHDQNRYYGAGKNTDKTASISFLAPPYDYEKSINEKRGDAMQMIGAINEILQIYIPGKVGRYQDDFEPRAFGDNIQKWGTRTILVESGGLSEDDEKQYLRKLNFVLLMSAFELIANNNFERQKLDNYFSIPLNESNAFMDLIVRNVQYRFKDQNFTLDLGFRKNENESGSTSAFLHDIGDLSIFYGYDDFDAKGYEAVIGKIYPEKIMDVATLMKLNPVKLLMEGYTSLSLSIKPFPTSPTNFPFKIGNNLLKDEYSIYPGKNPYLILKKNGKPEWIISNGNLISLSDTEFITTSWNNYILKFQKK